MQKQNTNRVSARDLEGAIFRPNNEVNEENTDRDFMEPLEREVICFTIIGKQDYISRLDQPVLEDENHLDVFAKIVVVNQGNPKYLVKRDSNGRLFNPLGIDEGNHNKFIHSAGKDQYEFRSVNKKSFDHYVRFLSTKNLSHLRTAEQEIF